MSASEPIPPVSGRDEPRFRDARRKEQLAAAFASQGADYDRLRPGYPAAVLDAMLEAVAEGGADSGSVGEPDAGTETVDGTEAEAGAGTADGTEAESGAGTGAPTDATADAGTGAPTDADGDACCEADAETEADGAGAGAPLRAVDLGAGTGKLALALRDRGLEVVAVDTSTAMLDALRARDPRIETRVAPAEATGLHPASAHLVTAAQAWHWFDGDRAAAEVRRLLAPGGVLALLWNSLDVSIPWVHRLSRIMHAGDVHREGFTPSVGAGLEPAGRLTHRWEDPMPTPDIVDLSRTRSYVITAPPERRERVLANLDWYLHDHLSHERGAVVGVPYRTDLFLYRAG